MIDSVMVFLAEYFFLASIGISGVYFLRQSREKQKQMFLFALIVLPLIGLTAFTANHIYSDPRPFVVGHFNPLIPHAPDNGFPSDHTLLTASVAMIVCFFNRRLGLVLGVIAVVVGASRVFVGLHHTIDIVGSILIVVVITTIVNYIVLPKKLSTKSKGYKHDF